MPIHLACPSCGVKGSLPDAAAGKSARCPRCKATLVIPILNPPPAPVAPPPPEVVPVPTHHPEDDREFDPTAPPDTHTSRRYNPFDDGAAAAPAESEVEKTRAQGKKKYTSGYNPFEGAPAPEDAPAEDPFDYSESDGPANPAGAFEFDQPTPRRKRR